VIEMEEYIQTLLGLWTLAFFIGFFGAGLFERVFGEVKAFVYYPDDDPWNRD
tara:strand:+ start:5034 stop:5189 length:156 start_codon:yes stop_codon:yes gene_type:complete